MCLFGAIKFLIARYRALFPTQSGFDAVFDTGFAGALNRHTTDMQSLMNLLIRPSRALWALIGLQKNAGSRQFVSRGFPFGNQSEEVLSFLIGSGDFVAFGWHEPLLSRRAHPVSDVWMQDNSASCMHQIKSDSALECGFVTAAGADLMELNDIATRIAHEHLIGIVPDQPLNLPVPHALTVQFVFGFLDIFHRQRYVWDSGIFKSLRAIGERPSAPIK